MKLSRLPGLEQTVKHSFSFRKSTTDLLLLYQKLYEKNVLEGREVPLKDLVEQILLDFMADDKVFQRELQREQQRDRRAADAPRSAQPQPPQPAPQDQQDPVEPRQPSFGEAASEQ